MVEPSQSNPANNSDITVLESQIRECYGRVVWTHKLTKNVLIFMLHNLKH